MRYNSNTIAIDFSGRVDRTTGSYMARFIEVTGRGGVGNVVRFVPTFSSTAIVCSSYVVSRGRLVPRLGEVVGRVGTSNGGTHELFGVPIYCSNSFTPSVRAIYHRAKLSGRRIVTVRSRGTCLVCVLKFLPNFTCLNNVSGQVSYPQLSSPHVSVPDNSINVNKRRAKVCPVDSPNN